MKSIKPHINQNAAASGINRKLTKEEINALNIETFAGPLHFINAPDKIADAVKILEQEKLLGFDTETRPTFRKGQTYPPALLQLATSNEVFIFKLHDTGLPAELCHILSDPTIIKAGVAIDRDVKELRTVTEFAPSGFVDLGTCARHNGIQHHGLRGLAALLLNCRITKQARLTNWARPKLSKAALIYAATDAWISRRIYQAMTTLNCHITIK